ncbi:MAG: Fic family protein [Kiritimatiellae bacterium]|nr:Fic family protein [Kiritimatiellia bacterium]
MTEFGEYKRAPEPEKREKAIVWRTAIGLQKVDGLTTSEYLRETARRNIEGEITIEESGGLIAEYYKSKSVRASAAKTRTDEADIVSQRIAAILSEPTFSLTVPSYLAIHRKLFHGVFPRAGKIRDYNITKAEWVLDKDTVRYESADVIADTLEYEFSRQRNFSYKGLGVLETISHVARFLADVWQIHPFGEGNTRTTAVFAIKYLRSFGFPVTNELFAENACYFRNALVRANYTNVPRGVHRTFFCLERFLVNLLADGKYELKSRCLKIGAEEVPDSLVPSKKEQEGEQVESPLGAVIPRGVRRLVKVLKKEMSVVEMMIALKLAVRRNFLEKYLSPALEAGLVEMTQPDSPRSPTQKYRLTAKGLEMQLEGAV